MKKEYNSIDIAKLFFAIGIVAIHCKMFSNESVASWIILHAIFRLAVPFFFCSSGFFLYKSLEKNNNIKETTFMYIKRLIIPLLFWLIMNSPLVIYNYIKSGDGLFTIILKIIRGLIFYPWGSLWFLSSLIVSVLIVIPFYKKKKLKNAIFLGIVLYLFTLICNTYYFLVENTLLQKVIDFILKVISSARNGVFEGLLFVSIGMYISKLFDEKKVNYKNNNATFLISYILLIVEIILTMDKTHVDDHSLFISFIFLIPSLFIFLSQFNFNKSTIALRNYSTGIYFSHRFILGIISLIINDNKSILVFIITIIIDFVFLKVLYRINNKKINLVIK